ncbi:hypothetical protein M231_03821 [Tremella mesenterica]|uniref:Cyclin-dependent protein kinase inhibitor n=1 Tax=Tremella mesenterica TaxID=5217 RepID=A0A4Q1BMI7_TREME|nr:hypothetical protein M231_03821 [Tremella mesenterica]
MKFGKTIQSQQVPGWGEYYLNYKALKKIINSYAAGRSAADAALLSLGLRPPKRPLSSPDAQPTDSSLTPAVSTGLTSNPVEELTPLPPTAEPPAQSQGMTGIVAGGQVRGESFKAHRDVFFFTLQRELEKINAFYLIKERELRLRLLTLLTSRKRLLQSSAHHDGREAGGDEGMTVDGEGRKSAEWINLEEGWRVFERDLGKLQGFIEINATGFRKILKKWDKRSKSNTKEMYLERQVEVQPCFNREFIATLSDVVAANLLDLENGSDRLATSLFTDLPGWQSGDSGMDREANYEAGQTVAMDALVDLEANFPKALSEGREGLINWLRSARSRQQKDKDRRVMRVLWRAAVQVPEEDVDLVVNSVNLAFDMVDDINGRTPLHEACIAGNLKLVQICAEKSPSLREKPDAYGRRPLHYAALHGHTRIVSFLLHSTDPTATDMDGYTPLMHAIVRGHISIVQIFVDRKISLEPTAVSNDLIPLSLACQYGHVEVASLLLKCGAKVLPNSEGLYPQHFAAKAGHEAICRLLVEQGGPEGGGKDRPDKYNLWTPLHHAAVGGEQRHLGCIKVLVEAGCDVNCSDEYGKSPGWYAAWYGHVECLNFLIASGARLSGKQSTLESMENLGLAADPQMDSLSPGSDLELDATMDEFELIPSLSLPPPIIPLRVYGHEFLAQRCLVQISLGHPFSRAALPKPPPVKLYSRSGQDSLHLWSSLKLVMTSKSDMTAPPHSVILPLSDERELFTFQVQSLERFTLELSLYPTFGSKVIGRAIIHPSTFHDIKYHKGFIAPLLDQNLKAIGEVIYEVSCIRPFQGAQLEIGGRVETYWKSKVTPSAPSQDHAHQYQLYRPLSVSSSDIPIPRPGTVPPTSAPRESALVTASSLSGEYLHIIVQVTRDLIPVVYSDDLLPLPPIDPKSNVKLNVGVSNVTLEQFDALASTSKRRLPLSSNQPQGMTEWHVSMENVMTTLDDFLNVVPSEIGLNLQLKYVRDTDSRAVGIGPSGEVNEFVDSVLHVVYRAGKENPGRKIIFSSFDPTVCTALNWKQPNYAVLFASYCGIAHSPSFFTSASDHPTHTTDRTRSFQSIQPTQPSQSIIAPSQPQPHPTHLIPIPTEEESDLRCLSVREAVNFAKSTNLLGVILHATTLAAVPSLVASVKDAGLLLAAFGETDDVNSMRQGASDGRTVDAFVIDG